MWTDIVCVLFACVAANHLGLIGAVGNVLGHEIPIINCSKCLSFWCAMIVCLSHRTGIVRAAAISFLVAYLAVWLELGMGFIDTQFNKIYDKIYSTTADNEASANPDKGYSDNSLPEL